MSPRKSTICLKTVDEAAGGAGEAGEQGEQGEMRGKMDKGNNILTQHFQCPMPNAQCPMPNAQCPMPFELSQQG
ncbi:hypothetical protein [Nostoc sp. UHCC 0251]|uniref:hypothetical protein n=1 Tax=Nostoc sp. UHCC 0251 TaxID=3110240 RepID=UPI002B1FB8D8|nr:hypothetical protein [Nostoc sp. UHCC 0251]MEA5627081.1 hypothetical protein [Nostoc sp. UHCC 0251]